MQSLKQKEEINIASPWKMDEENVRFEALSFPHFFAEPFVDNNLYAHLQASFPETQKGVLYEGLRYNLSANNPEFIHFLDSSPAWKLFIRGLISQDFVSRVQSIFWNGMRRHFTDLLANFSWISPHIILRARRWKLAGGGEAKPWEIPVRIGLQFSKIGHGMELLPHNDSASKIASMLFYVPPANWSLGTRGGTVFYKPKAKRFRYIFGDPARYAFDAIVQAGEAQYKDNNLACFLKTKNAFHGINPITIPDGVYRDSVNIFIQCAGGGGFGLDNIERLY